MPCLPFLLPLALYTALPAGCTSKPLEVRDLFGTLSPAPWPLLDTQWVPSNLCCPLTTYFALVDVQPLGRLRIFVCFPFLWLYFCAWLVSSFSSTQNSRSWGNWSFCSAYLSVWWHLLSPLLSREPGDPLTVFYIYPFTAFVTLRNFFFTIAGWSEQDKERQCVWLMLVLTVASVWAGQPYQLLFKEELEPPSPGSTFR